MYVVYIYYIHVHIQTNMTYDNYCVKVKYSIIIP